MNIFDKRKEVESKISYDQLLLSYIEKINNNEVDYNFGNEGFAYYVGNDFIVKEFRIKAGDFEEHKFQEYFKFYYNEIKSLEGSGIDVPKIYAWLKLPTPYKKTRSTLPYISYYILEEQAKGRELYFPNIEDFYGNYKNEMTFEEYQIKLKNPLKADNMEIYRFYISDFLKINSILESLPDSKIEKLILDAYKIYMEGKYSLPDLYSSNIFLDDNNLKMIDQKFEVNEKSQLERFNNRGYYFINELIKMFIVNSKPQDYIDDIHCKFYDNRSYNFFEEYYNISRNSELCTAAMQKFLKAINRCLDNPKFKRVNELKNLKGYLYTMVGKKNAKKLLTEINKNEMQ